MQLIPAGSILCNILKYVTNFHSLLICQYYDILLVLIACQGSRSFFSEVRLPRLPIRYSITPALPHYEHHVHSVSLQSISRDVSHPSPSHSRALSLLLENGVLWHLQSSPNISAKGCNHAFLCVLSLFLVCTSKLKSHIQLLKLSIPSVNPLPYHHFKAGLLPSSVLIFSSVHQYISNRCTCNIWLG